MVGRWLPLALLALLLQVLAPAWAASAMAAAGRADPLADVPICVHGGTTPTGDHAPGHAHDLDCPACQVCCAGHAPIPLARAVALPRPHVVGFVRFDRWRPASPRGPPATRARARSPPAFS